MGSVNRVRRPVSAKPSTCTEGVAADAAGISVKVTRLALGSLVLPQQAVSSRDVLMSLLDGGLVSPGREGTPQGGPLSPLLSNVVLAELDQELARRGSSLSPELPGLQRELA